MSWTEERVEALKQLWNQGVSVSKISAKLEGMSRSAVIGKVHRLGLEKRGRRYSCTKVTPPAPPKPPPVKEQKQRAVAAKVVTEVVSHPVKEPERVDTSPATIVVPISRRLKLVELTEQTCKWPNGSLDDIHFCGNPVKKRTKKDAPYCEYHCRLAYQPIQERRRQAK